MSLDGVMSVAVGGLANINHKLRVVSQNVANASTPDYAREVTTDYSISASGQGMGVRRGPVERAIDKQLQVSLFTQNATVARLEVRQTHLQRIDAVQGTPGQGQDLASLVGKLTDSFSKLAGDASNPTQLSATVATAATLARQLNDLTDAVTTERQNAQHGIVTDVNTLNTALSRVGTLSNRIVELRAIGQNTADLENQRDATRNAISRLLDVRSLEVESGDMILMTPSGLRLPTRATSGPFSTDDGNPGPTTYHPGGGLPGIILDGHDVTAQLQGGAMGARIELRDATLPTFQAGLDEFAQTLSTRMEAQGLRLFTDASGNVPVPTGPLAQDGYVGYAGAIRVNPAVVSNPGLLRDGTHAVAGSASGPTAFTPNPSGGPAGFSTMITRVLDYALGADARPGVAHPSAQTAGLGPTGTLDVGFAAPADIPSFASTLVSAQSQASSDATAYLSDETAVQSALKDRMSSISGVSMDAEMASMVQLQSLYAAHARLISVVQTMWTQTLEMVR